MHIERELFQRPSRNHDSEFRNLKIVLVSQNEHTALNLQAALAPLKGVTVERAGTLGKIPDALAKDAEHPRLLIADVDPNSTEDIGLIQELKRICDPAHVPVVALLDTSVGAVTLRAIRAGAADILSKPVHIDEAREVFSRVLHAARPVAKPGAQHGKVIAFMHLSGGVGASTLAVNAACALAKGSKPSQTCLLDLDIQFGSAASLLDLSAASPIEDVIEDPKRLDSQMLESMMPLHSTGVRVLTAPRTLLPFHAYGTDTVGALLDTARREFDTVVLDLPVALAAWTDTVLRSASVIYLVTSLTVPSVHRLAKFLELLRDEGMTNLPLHLVVNRYRPGPKGGNDISLAQFEKAIGRKVDFLIPNDYSLISLTHGQGKPAVLLKPSSPFSQAVTKMLSAKFGKQMSAPKRGSWFSFRRS